MMLLSSTSLVVFGAVLTGRRWLILAAAAYGAVVIAWFLAGVFTVTR